MTILFTAIALSAAPAPAVQPAPPAPAMHAQHAQHAQPAPPGAKPQGEMCPCCKQMPASGKMECCSKRGESHGAQHSGHSANR